MVSSSGSQLLPSACFWRVMAFLLIAPPHLFLLFFFLFFSSSTSRDTLLPNQAIRDGETLVSAGKIFALGFFSPGSSTNRYVGIWYYEVPDQTVVWVANRENPLANASGILTLVGGDLAILDETRRVVWLAQNATTTTDAENATTVRLRDSGNLVLSNGIERRTLWESFDHPTDTGLPGMKLGFARNTGVGRFLSSWKSPDDPAAGEFSLRLEPQGQPEFMLRKGSSRMWRSGPWNGLRFSGAPGMIRNFMYSYNYVTNENETYFMFNLYNASIPSRWALNESGKLQRLTWLENARRWNLYVSVPANQCDEYGKCGINGVCNPETSCECLRGFQPRSPQEWYLRDGSDGCERRKTLTCSNGSESHGFLKVQHVKVPDTSLARVERGGGLKECHDACLRNCSCTAYSTADISGGGGGSGCVMWGGDLMDLQVYYDGGQDLYVRVLASELESKGALKKKIVILITTVISGLILIAICYYLVHETKKKRKGHKMREIRQQIFYDENNIEDGEEAPDLPLFQQNVIAAATNNFSNENKLGEGGFGPVYKGRLINGKEIAVKRLSKKSGQGSQEFKNEVMLIAKLQHRNLVRILGCCTQGEERMLIYEYMKNKSLDSFIFDESRRELLDWSLRLRIIMGIARGVLYLHEDSRLRIIHRDLKASNVLLDDEMNPRISDFGMARIFGGNQTQVNTNRVVGTYGYMAPEYAMNGLFSPKSDVFSFGVLLLEIINGKRNNGSISDDPYKNLIGHAWELWQAGRGLEVVDPMVASMCNTAEVRRCIQVGLLCVQEKAIDRPTMASVIFMLANDTAIPPPKKPAFCVGSRFTNSDSSASGSGSCSINEVHI